MFESSRAVKLVEAIDRLLEAFQVWRELPRPTVHDVDKLNNLHRDVFDKSILAGFGEPPPITGAEMRLYQPSIWQDYPNRGRGQEWEQSLRSLRAKAADASKERDKPQSVPTAPPKSLDDMLQEFQLAEQAIRDNDECKNSLGIAYYAWLNFPRRMWEIDSAARKAGPRIADFIGRPVDWTEETRRKAVSALHSLHVRATDVLVKFAKHFEYDPSPIGVSSAYCQQIFREGRFPDDIPISEDALFWPDLLEVLPSRSDAAYIASLAALNTAKQLRDKASGGGFDRILPPLKSGHVGTPPAHAEPQPMPTAPPAGANAGEGEPLTGAERDKAFQDLESAAQKAYLSFQYAESKKDCRLEDREAYNLLTEEGIPMDQGNLGPLVDYQLPNFDTWARKLRDARKVLREQKYKRRGRAPKTRSIVTGNQIENQKGDGE